MEKVNMEQYLCVKLGGRWLGVDATQVVEIINPSSEKAIGTSLNTSGKSFSYHGQILPAIYLSDVLLNQRRTYDSNCRILVADYDGQLAGLVVDSAEEIIRVPEGTIVPVGETIDQQLNGLSGMLETEERKIDIISLKKIFELARVE